MNIRNTFLLPILLLSLSFGSSFAATLSSSSVQLFAAFCQTSTAEDGDDKGKKKLLEEEGEEEEEPDCD